MHYDCSALIICYGTQEFNSVYLFSEQICHFVISNYIYLLFMITARNSMYFTFLSFMIAQTDNVYNVLYI